MKILYFLMFAKIKIKGCDIRFSRIFMLMFVVVIVVFVSIFPLRYNTSEVVWSPKKVLRERERESCFKQIDQIIYET
jgi:hypothetical protein